MTLKRCEFGYWDNPNTFGRTYKCRFGGICNCNPRSCEIRNRYRNKRRNKIDKIKFER